MLWVSKAAAQRRKGFFVFSLAITFILTALALAPSVTPGGLPFLKPLTIDTDPENMLPADAPVRVRHGALKSVFDIYDFVVVGVVNEKHPQGVFNARDLSHVKMLTDTAKSLSYERDGRSAGIIAADIIAPSTVDNIETESLGAVSFSWLMATPPESDGDAARIRDQMLTIPMYKGTMISDDGTALALYYPISDKSISYAVEQDLRALIDTFEATGASYHITGLPVAEDRFGSEMFFQMAVSAPLAMLFVFGLLWLFFGHVRIILISLLAAMASVVCTMALLVISGQTVHIMSSMIPIFIIPIAVLDDIHILSDFYDKYTPGRDRLEIVNEVMADLWRPMWYTTLTTAVGFASLMLTPIPPVQVFGLFVAIGVFVAWFFTVTLLPAYFMSLPDKALADFGALQKSDRAVRDQSWLGRFLRTAGPYAGHHAKAIIVISLVLVVWAGAGITKITVNDNPIKWFERSDQIRVADRIINEQFAGSYMAYLHLSADSGMSDAPFKNPELLRYMAKMSTDLEAESAVIGKISGLDDIVATVHRELFNEAAAYRIPDTQPAVAQTLLMYENSHRPDDIWTFVTPDFQEAILWFQLKSGDNSEMAQVEILVGDYLSRNPPPLALASEWFGLTYINLVWQDKMVSGMLKAFLGSFIVVLILTTLLFRSLSWGVLAMIPLVLTVSLIYGAVGWAGVDYDMPTAVLSSLSLGLAVDYAIHFLTRTREIFRTEQAWEPTLGKMFEAPSRAITRNVIVVGVGFLPLLAANLVPYRTVGILITSILILAGATSLIVLPALISVFQQPLFRRERIPA
ncbi:MAG: MMPL family transporter [Hyphomonas sp.]|uniref:RND superfamily exporter n=1 Tax=Hyphomonas oceanitis SCH89 TaxID=1280953 RepID=A0A059G0V6_9PROT|nr:MMPL family transporter [Hyphomonas oceanitis]KCZ98436.1 RND superfamily exporter [Hyphomonas oceanitis SCH89]